MDLQTATTDLVLIQQTTVLFMMIRKFRQVVIPPYSIALLVFGSHNLPDLIMFTFSLFHTRKWTSFFDKYEYSRGFLEFTPSSTDSSAIVDELATLLTDGRLSSATRTLIAQKYDSIADSEKALGVAQKLIVSSPEFHATNIVNMIDVDRPPIDPPPPSSDDYKAVVYVMLDGGLDSFNTLGKFIEVLRFL